MTLRLRIRRREPPAIEPGDIIMTILRTRAAGLAAALVLAAPAAITIAPARAADLTIGVASEPSSIDPHFHNLGPNNSIRRHVFESLIGQDARQRLYPLLAESWEATDDTTWVFKLRQGVSFHDGTPFDAEDVKYTIERIPTVPNSPSSFGIYTKAITAIDIRDRHTIIIRTAVAHPLLPTELSTFGIISKETAQRVGLDENGWPKTEDFNSGRMAIGTGPYKFVTFTPGDRVVLARNEDYWGDPEPWGKATFRFMSRTPSRVAAMLAGDVDMIDKPSTSDLDLLRKNDRVTVVQGQSNRVIYLHLDQHQEPTPGIKGTDGRNPFKDVRVRRAVSMAIDRRAIVAKIMGGVAVPAAQLLPRGMFGNNPLIPVQDHDAAGAKALLAEAGYPDGFQLVLGTPNDRYINDAQVAQAVASFLTRIGIRTTVDAMTKSTFFSRRNNYEFSLYLAGWGAGTGEMSSPLKALVATRNRNTGMGSTNRGRYTNPALDALIEQALGTISDARRSALLQQASALAMEDYAILPLHYEVTPWAVRTGITYEPRTDQYTLAMGVRPGG